MLSLLSNLLVLAALLFSCSILTALNAAFRKHYLQELSPDAKGIFPLYYPAHLFFFPYHPYEGLLCALNAAQAIVRFFYCLSAALLLYTLHLWPFYLDTPGVHFAEAFLFIFASILAFYFLGDFIPRILGGMFPGPSLTYLAPLGSVFLFVAFPITYASLKFPMIGLQSLSFEEPLTKTKREIMDIIQKIKVGPRLNSHEKKLIEYVLRFKDRIAREVMVPRVDVFSLPADTPIKQAAALIEKEGYSRIPIYRNTVDNIIGVVMYKDIINKYLEYAGKGNDRSLLDAPIESIQKSVLYTPETKKISNLLLEFRKKQVHLAIVVDEYGGTEGIVTIEDILEEIVGEIEDEYDQEEDLFFPQADGSWVVDARMNILDIEEQLGIEIPQEGDYDTLGGYIFHCLGSIPSKGYTIHQEGFDMEILRSDERRVERVRIKPLNPRRIQNERSNEESEEKQ